MGYTTEFVGRFVTNKKMSDDLVREINYFVDERHGDNLRAFPGFPGFYCQWIPSDDAMGIQWDGGEKFYAYEEWLQLIMDRFLKPAKINLKGRVLYRGESPDDVGYLEIKKGQVVRKPLDIKVTR